jgi:hypothetical protein
VSALAVLLLEQGQQNVLSSNLRAFQVAGFVRRAVQNALDGWRQRQPFSIRQIRSAGEFKLFVDTAGFDAETLENIVLQR